MTLTTHVAIGAGIGVLVGNPALGFALGLVSHFMVDMIPHGDTRLADRFYIHKEKLVPVAYTTTDAALAVILLMFLVTIKPDGVHNSAFAATVIGSVLPDLMLGVADIFKSNKTLRAYNRFHFFFHDYFSRQYGDVSLKYAIAAQAIFVLVVIKLIERLA